MLEPTQVLGIIGGLVLLATLVVWGAMFWPGRGAFR